MPAEGHKNAIAGTASPSTLKKNEGEQEVATVTTTRPIPSTANVQVGKPRMIAGSLRSNGSVTGFRAKVAASCGPGTGSFGGTGSGGFGTGGGGFGGGGGGFNSGGVTAQASGGNFYSPELSTDFLELPQSLNEQWNYYRFFYDNEPFVGQAIDIHGELPLSKLRLARPKANSRELADAALRFCEKWVNRNDLFAFLLQTVHEFYLIGEVYIFCEDNNPDMPREMTHKVIRKIESDGTLSEEWVARTDEESLDETVAWLKKNYKGWTKLRILPPEQIHIETFPFTDQVLIQLIPDSKTAHVINMADQGDEQAIKIVNSMDPAVVKAIRSGENISLNTDPEAGSFVHYMANKKSQYAPRGHSILQRCMRTIIYFDKLRQAQTSIASRHMTPIRLVYAEGMDEGDTEVLRDQIDLALQDPDYTIVTNFQVTWEEMNSNGRLLELSGEYDLVARQLYAGLGVTESLLNGESSYSGDRINLEVINTRYGLLREKMQRLVEEHFFKPMCKRMGFIEEDEDGDEVVIYPKLSFTRLALRDNQDTFDALFQLYQKGSLDVETILELLNIDPLTVKDRLQNDFATFNDASFNQVLQSLYGRLGDALAENTNIAPLIAERLGLTYEPPKQEDAGRF